MTTHRSLNKLEFKAHMSIHNFTDVQEEAFEGLHFTRDRFGKSHTLSEADGQYRFFRAFRKSSVITAGFLMLHAALAFDVFAASTEAPAGPNVRVESGDVDDLWSSRSTAGEEVSVGSLAVSDSTSVGLNENGDPSVLMRF